MSPTTSYKPQAVRYKLFAVRYKPIAERLHPLWDAPNGRCEDTSPIAIVRDSTAKLHNYLQSTKFYCKSTQKF